MEKEMAAPACISPNCLVSFFSYSLSHKGEAITDTIISFMFSSVLSSGRYALPTPKQPHIHLFQASAFFYLPVDDEPHLGEPSTSTISHSNARSLSWANAAESSTDYSDDTPTCSLSPASSRSRYRHHQEIADILEQKDLYNILGLSRAAASNKMELRRAYLSRSRACHPEYVSICFSFPSMCCNLVIFIPYDSKFPNNPEATHAFQKVSIAYNVLSDPVSKCAYDLHPAAHEFSSSGPGATMGAEETLRTVVIGIFNDFLDGDLEVVRMLLRGSSIRVRLQRQ